jgi:hypothetical protein
MRLLGAGGFAMVWLGRDDRLDDLVAIKVLAENWAQRMDLRARFEQEARVLRRTKSHRVVEVYDIDELPDGRPYFVMTYADRGSLADALRVEPLPVHRALSYGADIADGVQHLHDAGVLHRDVKPSNVLLRSGADGSAEVLVADLGLSRELARGSRLTLAAGTPGFMAPEQAAQDSTVGPRADIYGVGATVYFTLTGQKPAASAVPPSTLRPGLPDGTDAVILRALAVDPDQRWATAGALRAALLELAERAAAESEPAALVLGADAEVTEAGTGARTAEVPTVQQVEDPFAARNVVPAELPTAPPRRRAVAAAALLTAAVVVAAGLVWFVRSPGSGGDPANAGVASPATSAVSATPSAPSGSSPVSPTTSTPVPASSGPNRGTVVSTVTAVPAPPQAPPVAAPSKPLPGTLIRCAIVDGRDYFECFVFSRGNTAYALDFYAHNYEVVMWEKKPPGDAYGFSQHWQFWWIDAKSAYMLYNATSGRCLAIDGAGVGAQLHVNPCDPGSDSQLWNWTDTTSWILRSRLGNCLDVPRGEYSDGATPFGYTCNGNPNQRWLLRAT